MLESRCVPGWAVEVEAGVEGMSEKEGLLRVKGTGS